MQTKQVNWIISAILCLLCLAGCNKSADSTAAGTASTGTGSETQVQTVRLAVKGMHCNNCVQSIEGSVARLDGVQSVEADFEQGLAVVSFDPALTSEALIAADIESLGFTVNGDEEEPAALEDPADPDAAQPSPDGGQSHG